MAETEFSSLEHWRRHTHLLRAGLLQRVDELSVSDFPGATPNQVIHFLLEFLNQLGDVTDKAGSEDRLKMLSSLIRQLGIFLEWLDNAHTEQTPRGLVQLLSGLLNKMDPGSRVVARPQAQYNYSIYPLGKLLKKLVDDYIPHSKQATFKEHLKYPIKLISFPRIERDNILAHAIFGHELGHPIADLYLIHEDTESDHMVAHSRIQKQVAELVEQMLAGKDAADSVKLELSTKVFNQVLQVRKRALEELVSDAVGVLIFGPSAFFASCELFWSSNWDAKPVPNEWYPPSRMRIRLMLDLVDKLDFPNRFRALALEERTAPYVKAVNEFIDEARRSAAVTDDQAAINADPKLKIAYDWMHASLDKAIEFATRKTNTVTLDSETIFPQLPELIRRLELGIPPNEVGKPENPQTVDYRASLLAAWMFKLRGISPETGDPLSSKEIDRLQKKTLSAIEYVILQDKYTHQNGNAPSAGVSR